MKRASLWAAGIVALLLLLLLLAFRLSPWPSAAVITYMFSRGDDASEAALEKHVPAGIVARRDLTYGPGRDERFDLYHPAGSTAPRRMIVWVHGGAWIAGSKDGVANYLKVLAGHGYATVAVEYSTGFGSTYPRPVEQVNAALGHLVREAGALGIAPGRIVLAGDSAGAQIAAQIALLTTDPAYARAVGIAPALRPGQLSALLLVSGAYDVGTINLEGDHGWFLKTVLWAYSGTRNFLEDDRFRLASITPNVTPAFPRSFLSSGNADPLAPQAVALAENLRSIGVETDTLFFPADYRPPLPHEYQFNLDTAAGRQALAAMLAFIEEDAPASPAAAAGPGQAP